MKSRVFVPDNGHILERSKGVESREKFFFIHVLRHLGVTKNANIKSVSKHH
jgi:hypothetical protein